MQPAVRRVLRELVIALYIVIGACAIVGTVWVCVAPLPAHAGMLGSVGKLMGPASLPADVPPAPVQFVSAENNDHLTTEDDDSIITEDSSP